MKAISFYQWVKDNEIEWSDVEGEIWIFPNFDETQQLNSIISHSYLDDEGVGVIWKDGYLVINASDICEYYGFDVKDIFQDEQG